MDFLVDIGNVLLTFDFQSSLERLTPPDTDASAGMEALLDRKDDFEAGRIPTDEYTKWASEQLGFTGPASEFEEAWCDIFQRNAPMWETMEQLKKDGHRLILFSNTNTMHGEYIYRAYPEFALFDEAVFSYRVGSVKPEPDIYFSAIDTYKLTPEKTLYIDDLPQNIEEGEIHGFRCWQYDHTDHASFLKWLEAEMKPCLVS